MSLAPVRRLMACSLAVSLVLVASGVPSLAQSLDGSAAEFDGRVFLGDGVTPASGIVVRLVDADGETSYASAPTGDEGAFRVEGAPAGQYRVLADTGRGAYLAGQSVDLSAGPNRSMSLTLGGLRPNFQTSDSGLQSKSNLPGWGKWVIVGAISLAALLVIDQVTQDEEEEASDSL